MIRHVTHLDGRKNQTFGQKKSLFIYFTHAVVRHWQKFEKPRIFRKMRVFLADILYTQHVAKFPKQRLDKYQIYTVTLLKILLNIAKKGNFLGQVFTELCQTAKNFVGFVQNLASKIQNLATSLN
jgi:hypothetical protein